MLLYIHIPFCDSKCHYCSFNSYVDKFALQQSYMNSLVEQLQFEIEGLETETIETLFIGGGTPSTVDPELYAPLFKTLAPYLKKNIQITTEANPNSATMQWLEGMSELGINRVSFGVQSFDDKKLSLLGRAHSCKQAVDAVNNAHKLQIESINIDIIYAVAGDTKKLLKSDLDIAFDLPIDHISAYALSIESGTNFETTPHMAHEKLELTSWLFDQICLDGFEQYEISNFAKVRSSHNLGYWQYRPYIGLGAGAVGRIKNIRYYPHSDISQYIKQPLYRSKELLDHEMIRAEKLLLGLRSCVGADSTILNTAQTNRATILSSEGKLVFKNGKYYNTNYLLSDEIALFIETI